MLPLYPAMLSLRSFLMESTKIKKLTFILAKRTKFWFGFMAEAGFLVAKEKRDGFEDLVGILR